MKLIDLYYEVTKPKLTYTFETNGSKLRVIALLNNQQVGKVVFDTKPTKKDYKEYAKLLTLNTCILNFVKIDKNFQGQGFGNEIMQTALDHVKSTNKFDLILLEALPIYNEKLDVSNLVTFYSKFGFELVKDSKEGGKIMKLSL